jgi:dipeptidyl aminopeptidase/acylaminoacyl peptidase
MPHGFRIATRVPLLVLCFTSALLAGVAFSQEPDRRTANNGNVVLEDVPPVPSEIVAALNRYQNVRGASFRAWAADGGGLYIGTRFGDVPQLHRVDFPGGARHQLTFFNEPVGGVADRPGHPELVFSMDEGGSEFYQLYAFDPADGEHRMLTDGRSRNSNAVWSGDGARIAYTSTLRDGRSNDVWLLDYAHPQEPRILLEAPDPTLWAPADFSPDGENLLVLNYISITDSRIHVADPATGEMRLVAGGDDEIGSFSAVTPKFGTDGRGFYLATDVGAEFTRLAYQDIASGERRIVTADIPWNVEEFELSRDGRRAAFVVNEDAISRLYLMDPVTFEYEQVHGLPVGLIGGLEFSPDATRLAMTLNTPRTPSDVFTLELGDGGGTDRAEGVGGAGGAGDAGGATAAPTRTRWTYSEIGGLDPDTFVEPELVHYPTFDSAGGARREIPAFVYRPRREGPHPVIINIHGGPEAQYRPSFSSTFQLWVRQLGAAVIAPNVRGSSGYGRTYVQLDNGRLRENSVRDIGALLDWIEAQPDLDESRVAVVGGSYGGYMVLASAVHYSDRLAAAAEIVGISNFVTFLENTEAYRRDLRRPEYGDERDPEMRAFLESISPSNHSDRIRVPLLVAQGQNDPRVPVTESEQIVRAVRENGRDVWYMNALNEGHGFRRKENSDLYSQILVMFFGQYLAGD